MGSYLLQVSALREFPVCGAETGNPGGTQRLPELGRRSSPGRLTGRDFRTENQREQRCIEKGPLEIFRGSPSNSQ